MVGTTTMLSRELYEYRVGCSMYKSRVNRYVYQLQLTVCRSIISCSFSDTLYSIASGSCVVTFVVKSALDNNFTFFVCCNPFNCA